MDVLSNFVSLKPTEYCTAASTAKHLLRWCKTLRVPEVCVGDTSSHFKNPNPVQDAQGGVVGETQVCGGQLALVERHDA